VVEGKKKSFVGCFNGENGSVKEVEELRKENAEKFEGF